MAKAKKPPADAEQAALDADTVELAMSRWIETKKRSAAADDRIAAATVELRRARQALREAEWAEALAWRSLLRARGDLVD